MNKKEVKNLLISMRTSENEDIVNNLLGKIDLLTEEKVQSIVSEIGDSEDSIRSYLQKKIDQKVEHTDKKTRINEMYEYGITGNCVHLHLPVDLHQMLKEEGILNTMDIVNMQLLDAIEKLRKLQNDGFHKLKDVDKIYMISPIISGRVINFLDDMDFTTRTYRKGQLQDETFVKNTPEAQLATSIFGSDKNIGTAEISFETINSNNWQEKRINKTKFFEEKGIDQKTKNQREI